MPPHSHSQGHDERSLLDELESLQDRLLRDLDELNARLEQTLDTLTVELSPGRPELRS